MTPAQQRKAVSEIVHELEEYWLINFFGGAKNYTPIKIKVAKVVADGIRRNQPRKRKVKK